MQGSGGMMCQALFGYSVGKVVPMAEKLGHYEIIEELGRGGMGRVLKAKDPQLDRLVAIKVLAENIENDPKLVSRFMREARSAARLNHPNITQIHFIGEDHGRHFFAMEFVKGFSLAERIAYEKRLKPKEAADIILQCARGLSAAHRADVIHRDIKPANIMLDEEGQVKIADFGIAYMPDPNEKLTETGHFLGTPGYLSPEVCLGKTADNRSDIFSLGIVFYESLTGEVPFKGDSLLSLLRQVVEAEIPDVRQMNQSVDQRLFAILTKMIAKEPEKRYQSCGEMVDDLELYFQDKPPLHAKMGGLADIATGVDVDAPTVAIDNQATAKTELLSQPLATEGPPPPPASETEPATEVIGGTASPRPPADANVAIPQAKRSGGKGLIAALLVFGFMALAAAGFVGYRQQWFGIGADASGGNQEDQGNEGQALNEETTPDGQTIGNPDVTAQTDMPNDGAEAEQTQQASADTDEPVPSGPPQTTVVENTADSGKQPTVTAKGSQTKEVEDQSSTTAAATAGPEQNESAPENLNTEAHKGDSGFQAVTKSASASDATTAETATDDTDASSSKVVPTKAKTAKDNNRASPMPTVSDQKMAILILGDRDVADAMGAALYDYFTTDGFDIALRSDTPILSNMPDDIAPDPRELGSRLARRGFSKLLLVEVRITGQRELGARRRRATVYNASITAALYDTMAGNRAGRPLRKSMEFPELKMEERSQATALDIYHDLLPMLENP